MHRKHNLHRILDITIRRLQNSNLIAVWDIASMAATAVMAIMLFFCFSTSAYAKPTLRIGLAQNCFDLLVEKKEIGTTPTIAMCFETINKVTIAMILDEAQIVHTSWHQNLNTIHFNDAAEWKGGNCKVTTGKLLKSISLDCTTRPYLFTGTWVKSNKRPTILN